MDAWFARLPQAGRPIEELYRASLALSPSSPRLAIHHTTGNSCFSDNLSNLMVKVKHSTFFPNKVYRRTVCGETPRKTYQMTHRHLLSFCPRLECLPLFTTTIYKPQRILFALKTSSISRFERHLVIRTKVRRSKRKTGFTQPTTRLENL